MQAGKVFFFDEDVQERQVGTGRPASMLNQLQGLVVKGQLSNVAAGMPTDCPTREKHGWLGDAQVTVEEAMYNFDMAQVYTEYLNTIRDNQNSKTGNVPGVVPTHFDDYTSFSSSSSSSSSAAPAASASFSASSDRARFAEAAVSKSRSSFTDISWSSAYPLIARDMLKYYGDLRVVERHWETMHLYMQGLLLGAADGGCKGGLPSFFQFGDWCATEPRTEDRADTGAELAAFNYILSMDAMSTMARALGKSADSAAYAANATKFRTVFHAVFYNNATKSYAPNSETLQTLTAAPLALGGTIPATLYPSVVAGLNENIVNHGYHHTVGAVGAKHLLPQLAANGLGETAMKLATQTTYPSFGYWLSKGATTCWESWSGVPDPTHPPPPTHNHIFLCGGLGEWLYRSIGGIAAPDDGAGFETVRIAPDVTALGPKSAETTLQTVRGKVLVNWVLGSSGSLNDLRLGLTVPAGIAHATVVFKTGGLSSSIAEGGVAVWTVGKGFIPGTHGVISATKNDETEAVEVVVLSGVYAFASTPKTE